ncbi:MAG: tryptophan 7-halogenase [Chloroflexi bacterium]|nr:tryptophan 7-halogenase [Chloroflexota bacterium]
MKVFGASSCRKIAVVGRGTAGALAAASVSRLHPEREYELHHIYDSRIPVVGVGEGSWPSLVRELQQLTQLPHETVQQRLNGTRKFGNRFEGWGRLREDFTHYFTPQQVAYAYHLSADVMADLLGASTRAHHIDAKVTAITKVDGGRGPRIRTLRPGVRRARLSAATGPAGAHRHFLHPHQLCRHPPLPTGNQDSAQWAGPGTHLYPGGRAAARVGFRHTADSSHVLRLRLQQGPDRSRCRRGGL